MNVLIAFGCLGCNLFSEVPAESGFHEDVELSSDAGLRDGSSLLYECQDSGSFEFFSDGSEYPIDHDFEDYRLFKGSDQTLRLDSGQRPPGFQIRNTLRRENFYFYNVHVPEVGPDRTIQLYARTRFNESARSLPHLAAMLTERDVGTQSAEIYGFEQTINYAGWREGRWIQPEERAIEFEFEDQDVVHLVQEIDGTTVRQKIWLNNAPEPDDFIEFEDPELEHFEPGVIAFGGTSQGIYVLLAYGVGIDSSAPRDGGNLLPSCDPPEMQVTPLEGAATIDFQRVEGARYYSYRWRVVGEPWTEEQDWWALPPIQLEGLEASMDYEVEVRARTADGEGPPATAFFTTL